MDHWSGPVTVSIRVHNAGSGAIATDVRRVVMCVPGRLKRFKLAEASQIRLTLAEVIADECCGTGVTANTIAPSVLDTPANRRSMPKATSVPG